ncbi:hypothetical protein [Streptomyces sp. Ncost-T10-10d]|nr:hypothetical protein [Streptomyces sp. Ncost-T10-10d]SCF74424.1 hypothetical protein GA0115254_11554 [Streptomyces sp. Ncost-T10-10d]
MARVDALPCPALTPPSRGTNATLHTIYRSVGDVRPTTDVLALIEDRVTD